MDEVRQSAGSCAKWTSMPRCTSFASLELGLLSAPGSSKNSGLKSRALSLVLLGFEASSSSGLWPNWTSMPSPDVNGSRVKARVQKVVY
jgi:hypothetical protein